MYARLIEKPIATFLVVAAIFLFGTVAFFLLPVASLPDVEYPTIRVAVDQPGSSPATMARSVTAPLEQQLGSIMGLDSMWSTSSAGVTSITLNFPPGIDMVKAGFDVQAAIVAAQPDLPGDLPSLPRWFQDNPVKFAVLALAFTSDTLSPLDVDIYANAAMRSEGSTIPGVQTVSDYVRRPRAVRIEINPAALAARDITLEEVRRALANASVDRPKGDIVIGDALIPIALNDQLQTPQEIARAIIVWRNGNPVRLEDVATVKMGPENENYPFGTFNGKPTVAYGLRRAPDANLLETIDAIKERLPRIAAALPPSVKVDVALDRSLAIRAAVSDIELTLLVTTLLVVVVIFLFLRRFWITVIPSIAIPLCLAVTFAAMYILGFSLNNLTLMALTVVVGFVVDDAIVVIENISRHIEMGATPKAAAIKGVREVAFTIGSITLSLVAVFIPVLFMGGLIGELFRQFAITIGVAVLASGVVSLTITPVLCGTLLRQKSEPTKRAVRNPSAAVVFTNKVETWIVKTYTRVLDWTIDNRRTALLGSAAVALLTVGMYIYAPKGFLPQQDSGLLRGLVIVDRVITNSAEAKLVDQVGELVRRNPNVLRMLCNGSNSFFVELVPADQRTDDVRTIIKQLRTVGQVAGVRFFLSSIPELPINNLLMRGDYELSLTDTSAAELEEWAPIITSKLQKLPELTDVSLEQQEFIPQLRVEVDRDLAARLGVQISAIDATIQDAFGQRKIQSIHTDTGRMYVVMQIARTPNDDETILNSLYVRSDDGHPVPLAAFSKVNVKPAAFAIHHKSRMPVTSISFNLAPNVSLGDAVAALNQVVDSSGKPASLFATLEGTAAEFQQSLKSELWLILAALFVVYVILGILYESLLHPLTILSSLPSAGLGALLFLHVFNLDLSIISIVGILLLIGIAKKNAIMIVDFAIQAERTGASAAAAVRQACLVRFRPIMMTTIAAMLGALPLAISAGPGFELRRPLGVTIVGGLFVSQLLTLVSTPAVYLAISRFARVKRKDDHAVVLMAAPIKVSDELAEQQ